MSQQEAWAIKQYHPRTSKQMIDQLKLEAREEGESAQVEANIEFSRVNEAKKAKVEQQAVERASALKISKDFSTHFVAGRLKGQEITYEKWKTQAALGFDFDPSHVGETSWQHAAESILFSDAWIPKDVPLSEENFPSWWVRDHEDVFTPLLERIDKIDDPQMKQRANYIHDIVGEKQTQEYLHRYHPQQNMDHNDLAKDLAGTHAELSDDWSVPYKPHMNSVMFNHTLHSQIDVGVTETY